MIVRSVASGRGKKYVDIKKGRLGHRCGKTRFGVPVPTSVETSEIRSRHACVSTRGGRVSRRLGVLRRVRPSQCERPLFFSYATCSASPHFSGFSHAHLYSCTQTDFRQTEYVRTTVQTKCSPHRRHLHSTTCNMYMCGRAGRRGHVARRARCMRMRCPAAVPSPSVPFRSCARHLVMRGHWGSARAQAAHATRGQRGEGARLEGTARRQQRRVERT